jgi:general secretion pathway protein C
LAGPISNAPPEIHLGEGAFRPIHLPCNKAHWLPSGAPTTLDMALLGIIRRDNPANSMALIDTGGRQANYKQGNKIAESATLDQVNADHVVLLVDGARQILGFPNADAILDAPDAAAANSGDSMASLLAAALAAPETQAYAEPAAAPPL